MLKFKTMKNILFLVIFSLLFTACNKAKNAPRSEPKVTNTDIAVNYKHIEIEIEGMTCEIGCARTIQSKLSKVVGVLDAHVDFESKKGTFTYDANIVSKDAIAKEIAGIAGGNLYYVTKMKELKNIKNTK